MPNIAKPTKLKQFGGNCDKRALNRKDRTVIKVVWAGWEAISEGKLDGMTAFMQGKLKVEGDMSNAMQLQGVLAKLRS